MRIKSDVEFVKRECMSDDSVDWTSSMECRCGETVTKVKKLSDNKVKCTFSDGDWYYYTPACLEEDVTLEKGKKYTIAAGEAPMTFVEESENFAIFEGGFVVKKDGNEFVEVVPKVPGFLKKEWSVEVLPDPGMVRVLCGGFYVAEFTEHGLRHVGNLPKAFGFALDDRDAAKLVK